MTFLRNIKNYVLGTEDGAMKVGIHIQDGVTEQFIVQ